MHMVKPYKSSAVPTVKPAIILMRGRPLFLQSQHLPLFQVSRLRGGSFLVKNVISLKCTLTKGGY